jgi:hypothetical protein
VHHRRLRHSPPQRAGLLPLQASQNGCGLADRTLQLGSALSQGAPCRSPLHLPKQILQQPGKLGIREAGELGRR